MPHVSPWQYLTNNWKHVEALQQLFATLLQPIFGAMDTRKQQAEAAKKLEAAAAERKARLARLKAQSKGAEQLKSRSAVSAKSKAAAEDDDDDDDDEE